MLGYKVLHRELLKELTLLFLVCLAVLEGLIVLGRMVLKLGEILVAVQLSLWDVLQLIGYLTPFFLLLLLPVACMISMFLTFQRMSSDRELIALRSSGISLIQVMPAPVVFLLLGTGLSLFVSLYGVSWGMNNFQSTMLHLAENKAQVSIQPGVFNQDLPGLTIYAQNVDKKGNRLSNVFVQDRSHEDGGVSILAPEGRIRSDTSLGKLFFTLQNGRIYNQRDLGTDVLRFGEYTVSIDLGRVLGNVDFESNDPKSFSWGKLTRLSRQEGLAAQEGAEFAREVARERQKRMALPAACLVLGLFAIPMGWLCEGMKRYLSLLIILGMFLFYYALFMTGMSLAEAGTMSPVVALWVPNAVFLGVSCLLFVAAVRERAW
jgi:lipopolysaccharide export system permease protein